MLNIARRAPRRLSPRQRPPPGASGPRAGPSRSPWRGGPAACAERPPRSHLRSRGLGSPGAAAAGGWHWPLPRGFITGAGRGTAASARPPERHGVRRLRRAPLPFAAEGQEQRHGQREAGEGWGCLPSPCSPPTPLSLPAAPAISMSSTSGSPGARGGWEGHAGLKGAIRLCLRVVYLVQHVKSYALH